MNATYERTMEDTRVEAGAGTERRAAATCCGRDAAEMKERFEKGAKDAKAAVFEKFEEGKFEAEKLMRRGRHAVEDRMAEAEHEVKRRPFAAVGAAFAFGAVAGFLMPRPWKARFGK